MHNSDAIFHSHAKTDKYVNRYILESENRTKKSFLELIFWPAFKEKQWKKTKCFFVFFYQILGEFDDIREEIMMSACSCCNEVLCRNQK